MKAPDLLRAIQAGKAKCVTVFHGEERWFADQAVAVLCESFLGGDRAGLESVDGQKGDSDTLGVPFSEVLDDVRTLPMFSGRKLIYFRARSALDDEEVKGLLSLAKSAPEYARLVVRISTLGKGVAPRLTRAGAAVGEAKRLFEKPWPGNPASKAPLNLWIRSRASERGVSIRGNESVLLSSAIGNDLGALDTALSDLSSAVGAGGEITEEAIRELTGRGREFDGFSFGEAIYSRDAGMAMRIYRSAFTDGVEEKGGRVTQNRSAVVARLTWSVRYALERVYAARLLLDEGLGTDQATKRMAGNPAANKRAVEQARRFSSEELRRHFVLLTECEADIRRGLPEEAIIARLIVRLARGENG